MKNKYLKLLGKRVKPIVSSRITYDHAHKMTGNEYYVSSEKRGKMHNQAAKEVLDEVRKNNREQEWTIWGIYADGTFQLLSDLGYVKDGVNRYEFRKIK